jgi:hypothetical protein
MSSTAIGAFDLKKLTCPAPLLVLLTKKNSRDTNAEITNYTIRQRQQQDSAISKTYEDVANVARK